MKHTLYAAPGAAVELHGFEEELVLLLGPLLPLLGYHVRLPRLGDSRFRQRVHVAGVQQRDPEISSHHGVMIVARVGFLQEEKQTSSLGSVSRGRNKI